MHQLNKYVKDKVSIIIPTYNYSHYIIDTIESVLRQHVPNIEIIVIDDGSTDNTASTIASYEGKIKYIYQSNKGLSAARNAGILNSTGEYILFLDADDILGKHSLYGRIKLLKENPDMSLAMSRTRLFRSSSKGHPNSLFFEGWPSYKRHLDVHLCNFNIAPPHAFLLRRNVIDMVGLFDTNLSACEDYDFWLRALFNGHKFMFCKYGTVYYRRHKESMSQNLIHQRKFDFLLHQKLQQYLVSNDYFKNRSEILMAFISGVLCTCMRFSKLKVDPPQELLEICNWGIDEIKKITYFHNSCITYLYFLQSLLTLKYSIPDFKHTNYFKNRLFAAIPEFNFNGNNLKLFKNMFIYSFFPSDVDFLSRYRVVKYTFLLDKL